MKRIFFTAMMSLAITGLSASAPCGNYMNRTNSCDTVCYEPCPTYYPEPCTPCCGTNSNSFTIKADFLYWDVSVDGFGLVSTLTDTLPAPDVTTRNLRNVEFNWKPGYRIGANYSFTGCERELNLFAVWTWYRSTTSMDVIIPVPLGSTLNIQDGTGFFLNTTGAVGSSVEYSDTGSFKFERFDLGIMASSFNWNNFIFKPSVAFTYVYLKETFGSFFDSTIPTIFTGFTNLDSFYRGYGATLGLTELYPIGSGFGIYSDSQLTGMWGRLSTNLSTFASLPAASTSSTTGHWAGRFMFSQEVGAEYTTCMMDTFNINLHAGWQFVFITRLGMYGFNTFSDIYMNGVVAGLDIGF